MRYDIAQADVIEWCAAYGQQVAAGAAEPFHAVLSDFPYLLDFMGRGMRDAPHRVFAEGPMQPQVQALVDLLGVAAWEAAAILWYRAVCEGLAACTSPGSLMLAFAGPRTDDLLSIALRAAGWVVQDKIMYLYGSGMPHGLDLAKTTGDSGWAGYNTHLAPAYETVILAYRPIPGTYASVAQAYGTPGLNVDACRIARGGDAGNWPKNVIMQHLDACEVPVDCAPGCPVQQLADQSGHTVSKASRRGRMVRSPGDSYGTAHAKLGEETNTVRGYSDAGSAARFFYTTKATAWEREAGLQGGPVYMQQRTNPGGLEHEPRWAPKPTLNPHPTLKAIRAVAYLATLIRRPDHVGGRLLVPFSGVGSEMIGAHLAGWPYAQGIELDQDERYPGAFIPIAHRRVSWWSQFSTYEEAQAVARELGLQQERATLRRASAAPLPPLLQLLEVEL